MKFLKNNISYNSNDVYLNDNCNLIYNFKKKYFMSFKLFIQVIVACIYAFGLGYSLFYFDEVIKNGLVFLILLALSYLIIIILNELLHVLFYKDTDKVTIRYSLFNLTLFSCLDDYISKGRTLLLLLVPFILLAVLPTVASYLLGFNLFLYALASAGAIKTSVDLLNFIIVIKNVPKNGRVKVCGYDFYLEDIQTDKFSLESELIDVSDELSSESILTDIKNDTLESYNELPSKNYIITSENDLNI